VPVFIAPEEFASPPAHAMLLLQSYTLHAALAAQVGQREFFIDNLLVRIHYIIVMIK